MIDLAGKRVLLIIGQVIAHELSKSLTSLRVTNVYDLSSVLADLATINMPKADSNCREFSSLNFTSQTIANSY